MEMTIIPISLTRALRLRGCSRWPSGKELACSAVAMDLIPGLGRYPEGGNDNPLQHCCLGNPMDRGDLAGYSSWDHRVGHDLATEHET